MTVPKTRVLRACLPLARAMLAFPLALAAQTNCDAGNGPLNSARRKPSACRT